MGKHSTKLFLILYLCLSGWDSANGQNATGMPYAFSVSTAAIPVFPGGASNVFLTPPFRVANQSDEWDSLVAPAGWNFTFANVTCNKFVLSSNGWLALIPNSVATIPASFSGNAYPNNLLSNNTTGYPIIAPLWDDMASVIISFVVPAATNTLWVRWSLKWNSTNAATGALVYVKLDGNTNTITYYYPNLAYSPVGASASIGIAGSCPGDYYSVYSTSSNTAYVDSTNENGMIGNSGLPPEVRPLNVTYIFTPFAPNDNCTGAYPARFIGNVGLTCSSVEASTFNAAVSGTGNCATPDDNDVWFSVYKPAGIANVKISTAPSSCQSVSGTSVTVYATCGGASLGCATTSISNPNFAEVTVARTCVAETLWVRVTADSDIPGKFLICASDGGISSSSGATCANATAICSIPYSQSGLSTTGYGNDYDSTNSKCHDPFMNGEDYVFSYTPTTNQCIRIAVNSTGTNPGVFVFDGCPNLLGTTNCLSSAVNSTGNLVINSISLLAGITYYIVVDNNTIAGAPTSIPFNINITNVGTSQPYDACGAVNLGVVANNQPCVFSSYTTECATPSPFTYPVPTCGNFLSATGDIWFSFTAGFSGSLLIKTQPGATNPAQNIAMAVYTGINCGANSGAQFACDDNSGGSGMPLLSIPVANGTTYYIRVWTVSPANSGNFDLCLSSACSPPNDLPCTAVLVNLGGTSNGFNTCAGSVGEPPNAAQCVAGGIINTVWYKAVVPASGSLKVRTHTRSLTDTQIQAFTFPTGCANAATSSVNRGCNDDGPDCGSQSAQSWHDFSELTVNGLTPGDTLFIAVDGFNSQTGTFDITVIDGTQITWPPIAGADCEGAYDVCGPTSITVNDPGILGYGNICDFQPTYDCWNNGERNSAWYRVTVNPGVLQFDIQTFSDYDFIMWDITNVANPCSLITAHAIPTVRCNWVTTVSGHTGISIPDPNGDWEPAITVTGTPRTYLINIDNWNPPFQTTGYTIDWMGSPIASITASVTWQGANDTLFANLNNWGTPPCNATPTCAIDAVIASAGTGRQPTINSNMAVKNLTINSGATLRIKSGFTLDVCGNFTNNGSLIAEPGSTVRFIGTANVSQVISGSLTGPNAFANLVVMKTAGSSDVKLNSNIEVAGNFTTMNATSIFNINGKILKVGGHFTNFSGSTTFTGVGGSTVEFNGTINQVYTNNTSTLNLNRVTMNKPSGKLYLNGNTFSTMLIDSGLILTSGIINTRALPWLEVSVKYYLPACVSGHSAISFVDGKLRRKISNPTGPASPIIPAVYDFPVGDSLVVGGYELAVVTFTSSTLVFDLLAEFNPWPSGAPNPGPVASECVVATYSNKPIFNHGYWTLKRSTSTFGGNYTLALYNTGFTNNTGAGWTIAKSDTLSNVSLSSSWRLQGNCVLTSTATNTQRTNMNLPARDSTSFNHFYATVQTDLILPIELLSFNAEPYGEGALCSWETASETNNAYFDIERSIDGNEFMKIGQVNGFGQGISTTLRTYRFHDPLTCKDMRYYRLRQVDIDGQFSYSEIVAVKCNRDQASFNVYPNPAYSNVKCSFYESADGIISLQWIDMIGQVAKEEIYEVIKGYNTLSADIDDLAQGVYYLRIVSENNKPDSEIRQTRFIKN